MKVIVEFKQIGVDLDVNESDSRDTAISKYIQSMGGIQSTLNYILRNITFYKDEIKEVEEIKKIIAATAKNILSIVLLDELFKGTNTVERIASAKAVLTYLEKQNSQVLVSTHDVELTSLLNNEFDLFHFTESIVDSTISFDYKLKKGVPKTGNAIKILDINAFPKDIVQEAYSLVSGMQ